MEHKFSASFSGDESATVRASISSTPKPMPSEIEDLVFGIAATVQVGKVTAGEEVSVTNVGTPYAAVLDFVLPQGEQGPPGKPGDSVSYVVGHGLKLDAETNTLSVDTAEELEPDNTLPITSAAVYGTVGNIDALLQTI